jgi:hypothetical protein
MLLIILGAGASLRSPEKMNVFWQRVSSRGKAVLQVNHFELNLNIGACRNMSCPKTDEKLI